MAPIVLLPGGPARSYGARNGALKGRVTVSTPRLTFALPVYGPAIAQAMAAELAAAKQAEVRAGIASGTPLPALTAGTKAIRERALRRLRSGTEMRVAAKAALRERNRAARAAIKAGGTGTVESTSEAAQRYPLKMLVAGIDGDLSTPMHFTGAFARSIKAVPSKRNPQVFFVVAHRMYRPRLEQYIALGYDIMGAGTAATERARRALRLGLSGKLIARGVDAAIGKATEILQALTAAANGDVFAAADALGDYEIEEAA